MALAAPWVQALCPAATFAKYSRFARDQFVADRSDIKWCPAPGCTKAILVGSTAVARKGVQPSGGLTLRHLLMFQSRLGRGLESRSGQASAESQSSAAAASSSALAVRRRCTTR